MFGGIAHGATAHAPATSRNAVLWTMESTMRPLLLIAEGDAELREVYREALATHSYHVETAADGLECLEKLRRLMPEVLVLDQDLRWGGGDGVLAWLREQCSLARASVVLTAWADCPVDLPEHVQAPVVKLLPKPFTLAALLQSVRAAVAENKREEQFYLNRTAPCSELFIG
jgi:two-component system response regulator AtoC